MSIIWIIILLIILFAVLPTWPYSAGWGYFPSGILGILIIVAIALALLGRL